MLECDENYASVCKIVGRDEVGGPKEEAGGTPRPKAFRIQWRVEGS